MPRLLFEPVGLQDGSIHLSTAERLADTVDKHFDCQHGLQIVAVDLDAPGEAMNWEESRGSALFSQVLPCR